MATTLLTALSVSVGLNLVLFLIAYFLQTDKLTDFSYSLCFLIINGVCFYLSEHSLIDIVMFCMISVWAFRLGGYLFVRIMAMGRDARFDKFRERLISFASFWVVQAISIFIISLSFIIFYSVNDSIPTPIFWAGCIIALSGLILESIADSQKFQFKKANPNTFMHSGVWSKIRHPNYTGEIIFWVGIFVSTTSYLGGIQWLAICSPLWIILLLLKFSGIPPLEETWEEKYGDMASFREYKAQSYKLVPGVY